MLNNEIYHIIPLSVQIGNLVLNQGELIEVIETNGIYVKFRRLSTNTIHTVEKLAIKFVVEIN